MLKSERKQVILEQLKHHRTVSLETLVQILNTSESTVRRDLDELENLGAYEVAPEDFALTEFVCVSKQPHQQIIRDGLDLMMAELG